MPHVLCVESIIFINNVNQKWPKVQQDIPLFGFDPREAYNSLRRDCVGNGIYTQKMRKDQQRAQTVLLI